MKLISLHYFRGIAIVLIVAGHWIGAGISDLNLSFPHKITLNLILGGSALFVFISGFLFHHVFYKNFVYKKFIFKKINNVLLPYIVCSALPIFYYVFINKTGPHHDYYFSSNAGLYHEYIRPISLYLLKGGTFIAYWYIPFIMVIFAMSPLFIRYIQMNANVRLSIMLFMFIASMLIHRPVDNLSVMQSVVYYIPVYLLGIMASVHKEYIYEKFKNKEIPLLIAALSLSLIQVIFYKEFLNFTKDPFVITVLDINIIQKSILCIFFMVWLHRFENTNITILDKLAASSFAIYFLHPILIQLIKKNLSSHHINDVSIWIALLSTPIILFGSLAYAILIKDLAQTRSRSIIGW